MKTILFLALLVGVFGFSSGLGGYEGNQLGGQLTWTNDVDLGTTETAYEFVTDITEDSSVEDYIEGTDSEVLSSELPVQSTDSTPSFKLSDKVKSSGVAAGGSDHGGGDMKDSEGVKQLFESKPLELPCNVTEGAGFQWAKDKVPVRNDDHVRLLENGTLYIESALPADVGEYRCQVNKLEIAKFLVIQLNYKKLPKSTTVLEGDKLSLTCHVDSNPAPSIAWFKDDVDIRIAVNGSRLVLSPNEKNVTDAVLLIDPVNKGDRGVYACRFSVGNIPFNTTTFMRVKDIYAALWPFLGIVAEVIILCIIIFIYEKRRAKAEFEESDTDQGQQDTKNPSDHKESLRQRK